MTAGSSQSAVAGPRRAHAGRRTLWLLAPVGVAVALTALLYGVTVGYGFHYDDYHFVRPYTAHEVLDTFHGPWDRFGIETAYYRPLTVALYAVRFAVFGLNARANHLLSLAMFAAAAALFAIFAGRVSNSRLAGLLAAAVFVINPGMPYSAVAWVTNQMHVAELLVVFAAALWWFEVRRQPARWWAPLLLQAAAFLIKEDGVMLIPAILVLHALRRVIVERDLPHPPRSFVVAAAIVGAALLLVRASALHGSPSHHLPSFDQAWQNWTRGLSGAYRLLPAKRPWQPAASWFVTVLPIAALLAWRRLSRDVRFALAAGAVTGVLFVLPFAFIIKAEQLHLVVAGASLLLAAAAAGLIQSVRSFAGRALLFSATVPGLVVMAAVARDITRDFEPFGPIVLHTDDLVKGWAAVPLELREYLAAKPQTHPDPDPSRALPIVAFGLHGRETSPDGVALRWMAGATADVFARRGTRLVSFPVRHERGAFAEPAHVVVTADGARVIDATLDDGRWRTFDVALRQRAPIGLAGMHHIRIVLDHAWVPAKIIPGSGDGRTLGLQIGAIETRQP